MSLFSTILELVTAAFELGGKALDPADPTPNARRREAAAEAYRHWAERHRFTAVRNGYRGSLSRHHVVVSPGLQGSLPRAVVITIAIDPADVATEIEKALNELLPKPAADRLLRSIELSEGHVSLRFAPRTKPEVVERHARQAIQAIVSVVASAAARSAARTAYR